MTTLEEAIAKINEMRDVINQHSEVIKTLVKENKKNKATIELFRQKFAGLELKTKLEKDNDPFKGYFK